MKSITKVNLFIFVLLVSARTVYLFIPLSYAAGFERMYRPVIYMSAIILLFFVCGIDERPNLKKDEATLLAFIGVLLYYAVMFFLAFRAGFAKNGIAPNFSAFLNNLWVYGGFVVLSELLRYKIIRSAPADNRAVIAVVITLIYTYAQIDGLRSAVTHGVEISGFFFVSFLPALTLNAVLSYMSLNCSFTALLLLRSAFTLTPVLAPYLPDVTRPVWSIVVCTVLFVIVIIYYYVISGGNKTDRVSAARWGKYQKTSVAEMIPLAIIVILLSAFGLRMFPYYPVVILTGSMTGTINRGSVVFVQKVPPNDVLTNVIEGDIIHFAHGRIEVMHRVIEFRYNSSGERIYITKGDANERADTSPVEQDHVLGISRSFIPYIGLPVVLVHTIFGV